ncbi:MAG: hypothetical protein WAP49_07760, partial [Mycobacterium sp.]
WNPGPLGLVGLLGAGTLIGGPGGLAVFAIALTGGYLLRRQQPLFDRLTLVTAATGLILAGALLSRYPWRSVDGYIGQSPWVQLPALIALGALSASLLPVPPQAPERDDDPSQDVGDDSDETGTAASTSS